MAGGGGQDPGGGKGDNHLLWVIFLAFFIGFIIWWQFSDALKQAFIYIRLAEFYVAHWILSILPIESEADLYLDFMRHLTPDDLTWDVVMTVSEKAGQYVRIPVGLFLVGMLYFLLSTHTKIRYRKRYSMKSLMQQESVNWPQITPISGVDLVKQDLDEGPWAMGMTPIFFAKKYKILKVKALARDVISEEGMQFKATVLKPRAERVFGAQLGRPFTKIENMPIHRRALFAVFAARTARDGKAASDLLSQMASSAGEGGKIDFTGVDALWQKYYQEPDVEEFCQFHAYELTLLASALLAARTDGVLAVSDFIWIKPIDRRLWYTLSSVGRQTPFVEAAGVYAHWLAERALRRPLSVPIIEEAVKALEIAVEEIIYQPSHEEKKQILESP